MKKIITQNCEVAPINLKLLSEMEREVEKLIDIDINAMTSEEYVNYQSYLDDLVSLQQENGSFPLIIDPKMPRDVYYWSCKRITVIITKALFEFNKQRYSEAIKNALIYLEKAGLKGHGYDLFTEAMLNLTMLIKVGILEVSSKRFRSMAHELICNARKCVFDCARNDDLHSCIEAIKLLEIVDLNKFVFYGYLSEDKVREALIKKYMILGGISMENTDIDISMGYKTIKEVLGKTTICYLYAINEKDINTLDKFEGELYEKKRLLVEIDGLAYSANAYVQHYAANTLSMNKIKVMKKKMDIKKEDKVLPNKE